MAEWLIERGIGEDRAILWDGEAVLAARARWPDELAAGAILPARLVQRRAAATRGLAELADGTQVLVDKLPPALTEGAQFRLEITRPAMAEEGRLKRAQGRASAAAERAAPSLAAQLAASGHSVGIVTQFPAGEWDSLLADACARSIGFAGGTLLLCPTPALTLVDVDGDLPPSALACAAVAPLASALQRLDIGGSVAIDFPSLAEKPQRRAVDEALAGALAGWPHERTAMNGFGMVQIVSRLERVSILHRAALQPAATAARRLLRQAEHLAGPGITELAGHPALEHHLPPEWLSQLQRRTGRPVRFRAVPGLALASPHAQVVPL